MEAVKKQRNAAEEGIKNLSIYIAAVVKEIIEKLPGRVKPELLLCDDRSDEPLDHMYIWLSPGRMYGTSVRGRVDKEYDKTPEEFFGSYIDSLARADEVISKIEKIEKVLKLRKINIEGIYLPKEK